MAQVEGWIFSAEGKSAINWTRLSRHSFVVAIGERVQRGPNLQFDVEGSHDGLALAGDVPCAGAVLHRLGLGSIHLVSSYAGLRKPTTFAGGGVTISATRCAQRSRASRFSPA